ncbi:TlpA disulfide reductase family protein [uncultured Hydrogenophaga sp.]|uniref:TlpA family protein disulfide reductase n=1 Tax=uncultured Hydrogenophaga sp. TaxID=199683 RepID=UPI0026604175|nr:TlpA disulfide reductase family protein [uncultured Hydrogenophaga sp.]
MPTRRHLLAMPLAACLPALPSWAAQGPGSPLLKGTTLEGQAFDLSALRGKVVMVVFWSTGCAVCRDKMPELRANARGWAGQPFELVTVCTDADRRELDVYQRAVLITVPPAQRHAALWRGAPGHADNFGQTGLLPATWLIDKQGRTAESYHGRIPPEAWDRIADLL